MVSNSLSVESEKKKMFYRMKSFQPKWPKYILIGIGWIISSILVGSLVGLWYSNYLSEPEIMGRVLVTTTSRSGLSKNVYDVLGNKRANVNVPKVFLTIRNKRKVPISIVDYLFVLNLIDGIKDTCYPFYGELKGPLGLSFEDYVIFIKNNSQNLLQKKTNYNF